MPTLTWMDRPNYLEMLVRHYMKKRKVSSAMLGQKLGTSGSNVRHKLSRPAEQWRADELILICERLGIPLEEAAEAVHRSIGK